MKLKIFAFADFPSPYRVEVFKGLAGHYDLFVVFDKMTDQNRNAEWFYKDTGLNSISLLTKSGRIKFDDELKQLKKYDIVLAYDYHIKNAMRLEFACIRNNVPYIMNLDGAFIRKNPIKNLVKRILVSHAAGYFASGKHAEDYFKHFSGKSEKIFYHPFTSLYATEILKRPISDVEKKELRCRLKLDERKTVLSIGQFIPRKGFDILIRLWRDLDESYQLLIAGGGNEKAKYQKLIDSMGYKHVFLFDYMSKEKIREYYLASDVFVLATKEDIWGLVINEALAYGLPAVTTDMCLGGVELVEDGVNGYIVPFDNESAIHNSILDLLQNTEQQSIGENCLESIREYTYENVVESHIRAIHEILR